ncbi:MAG: hypothetical protein L7U72_08895 [Rubripirellula sp.]|nr:hypothetical protein [Rubripirellula sp.]
MASYQGRRLCGSCSALVLFEHFANLTGRSIFLRAVIHFAGLACMVGSPFVGMWLDGQYRSTRFLSLSMFPAIAGLVVFAGASRILAAFRTADLSNNADGQRALADSGEVDPVQPENRNPYTGELMTGTAAERTAEELERNTVLKGWASLGTWKVIGIGAVITGIASWLILNGGFNDNFFVMCLLLIVGFCVPFGLAAFLIISRNIRIEMDDLDDQDGVR